MILVLKKALQDSAYIMKQAGISQVPISSLKVMDYEKEVKIVLADKYYTRGGVGMRLAFITSENIFLKSFKDEIISRREFEQARADLFKKMSFFKKVKIEKIPPIF